MIKHHYTMRQVHGGMNSNNKKTKKYTSKLVGLGVYYFRRTGMSLNMDNVKKYLTIKLFFENNMILQKEAIINSISEWNKLHAVHFNKEFITNEEKIDSSIINFSESASQTGSADLAIYLIANTINNNSLGVKNDDNTELIALTSKSLVFFQNKEKDEHILRDFKVLIRQNIDLVESYMSGYDLFKLFKQLEETELLFLACVLNTNNIYFYPQWVNKTTFNLFNKWGISNNMPITSDMYDKIISKLSDSKLLEVIEYTEYGNPRLYRMPYEVHSKFKIYNEINLREETLICYI